MKEISGAKKERKELKNSKKLFIYLFFIIKGCMFINRTNEMSGLVSVLTGG